MLYVAIIPGWIYALLLLATWSTLVFKASVRLEVVHPLMRIILVVMALQVVPERTRYSITL